MEELFIITAVAGATELIKRTYDRDFRAATIIAMSAAIGLAVGLTGLYGATVASGLIFGLGASGLVTVSQKIGTVRTTN
ncbi:hypothetical protein [Rhodococcus sp. NPDC004095]